MARTRKRITRGRRPELIGSVYSDYPDTYSDYGDYSDTYPDYVDSSPYRDYGDYNDAGQSGRYDSLRDLIQKVLILEGEFSYLLAGDPDVHSSLFEKLKKDEQGRPVGVLPMLLSEGWQLGRISRPDPKGRTVLVVQRRQRREGGRTTG